MSRPLAIISLRNLSVALFLLPKMRAWTVLLLPAVARAARCAELPDGQMLPGFDGGDDEDARGVAVRAPGRRAACQEDFDATIYERADLAWTRTSYIQTQMHPFDRMFYEPGSGYTPRRFLDDLAARYGGVDALLLWPTYPNIGADARNQFDMFASMPGGLDTLAGAVAELEAAGVRVLLPYNPWDTSTNRSDLDDARRPPLRAQLGADGFNGDTMGFVNASFWDADEGTAIEPEGLGTPQMKNWHTLGWGYWTPPAWAPGVDFYKWAVDARWMTHACERWNKNHTSFVLNAYFNGVGFESWENVWGTWNGIVPRDGELVRRAAAVLRHRGERAAERPRGGRTRPTCATRTRRRRPQPRLALRRRRRRRRRARVPRRPTSRPPRAAGRRRRGPRGVRLPRARRSRPTRAARSRCASACSTSAACTSRRAARGALPPETAAFARAANLTAAPPTAEWSFNQMLLDAGRASPATRRPRACSRCRPRTRSASRSRAS